MPIRTQLLKKWVGPDRERHIMIYAAGRDSARMDVDKNRSYRNSPVTT